MTLILDAIEEIDSREEGKSFSYREVAKRFGVDRTTLARRHKGRTRSYGARGKQQQLLNPQQEEELVRYIERCKRRGLPPTREKVQNLGSSVAQCEVSQS